MAGRKIRGGAAITGALVIVLLGLATEAVSESLPKSLVENAALIWVTFGVIAFSFLGIAVWQLRLSPEETTSARLVEQYRFHRALMIQRQKSIWIDGALSQSLETVSKIELGLESRPGALDLPWNMVIRDLSHESRRIDARKSISEIFDQGGGALLILGAPGAGKTTLLLELAADLLQRADENQELPIPVVFNLSTWGRAAKPFDQWLEEELRRRYIVPRRLARQWLDDGMILPLLDGLDEVKSEQRGFCVKAINEHLRRYGPMQIVVCSRIFDYEEINSRLRLTMAILIQPLTSDQILSYIDSAGGQLAGLRLAVEHDELLLELLSTPLLLSVAALAYRELATDELTSQETIADHRKKLIDRYIYRMLQRRSTSNIYSSGQVVKWLSELAFQMTKHDQTVYHVEWMQPTWIANRTLRTIVAWFFPLVLGAITGLTTGYTIDFANKLGAQLFGLENDVYISGVSAGWLTGLTIGGLVTASAFVRNIRPAETVSWSLHELRRNARKQIRSGLLAGTTLALVIGIIMHVWGVVTVILFVILFEMLSVFFYVVIGGVSPTLRDVRTVPNEGIRRSMQNALLIGLTSGAILGTIVGFAFGARQTALFGIIDGLTAGLSLFVLTALHSGGQAWFHHYALRAMLWLTGQIPIRWVRFLQYSTEHILLRRVGGGYIFIHRFFLEHFAELHVPSCKNRDPQGTALRRVS